jgi:hypothetical protein
LFEIKWKTPHHNIIVEFLNNWKLNFEQNRIKVMMAKEQKKLNRHLLVEVFKICHTSEIETNHVKM